MEDKGQQISADIEKNVMQIETIFCDAVDVMRVSMQLGRNGTVKAYVVYIEVTVSNLLVSESVIGKVLNRLSEEEDEKIKDLAEENQLGIADISFYQTWQEAKEGLLAGNILLFLDGVPKAIKVQDKGYPRMGIAQADSEKSVRGSKEAFTDSVKVNAALIRRRLQSDQIKVVERKAGVRSGTRIYLVYAQDLVHPGLLEEIDARLHRYVVDACLDGGVIEQLAEESWSSPFPQFQTTQRPDRAAQGILEGRAVLLCDNSPSALILPVDYSSFMRTADDYYMRWEIATLGRMIRYLATFLAMVLPGLYLAVTKFHTQVLPTSLLLSFAAAREGVPFPEVFEVLLMEMAFELLREAGVRIPGTMGNTIGIVGGLIIGQAAVDANLISPIVVILVAVTALCSFAIPNEEFASSFRVIKFAFILLSGWYGLFGSLLGLLVVLTHLANLKSFGYPYLMPFTGADRNNKEDLKDLVIRWPYVMLRYRPIYAKRDQRRKLRRNTGKEIQKR